MPVGNEYTDFIYLASTDYKEIKSMVDNILELMTENPQITAEQIALKLNNITSDGVRYHITKLKREGSTK